MAGLAVLVGLGVLVVAMVVVVIVTAVVVVRRLVLLAFAANGRLLGGGGRIDGLGTFVLVTILLVGVVLVRVAGGFLLRADRAGGVDVDDGRILGQGGVAVLSA